MDDVIYRCLLGAALCLIVPRIGLAAEPNDVAGTRFEFTQPEMGVPFRIVLYARDSAAGKSAAQKAFQRVEQLNEILSDYETDSELNQLSRQSGQGKRVPVSPELWFVLERAQRLAEQTDGAFDVTVGPVISLWRRARRAHQLPESDRLSDALKAVGYKNVRLHPEDKSVELTAARMKLDLGGIAKGYALDEVIKTLEHEGITRALATGGGDMAMSGPPPDQTGWRIEIAPLDATNAPPKRFVRLAHAALATSGDVFQRLEIEGKRYSHIVDPHTGVGLTDHSLVTIIAQDCTTADSLATAVSVLGPTKGLKLIESIPGAEVHLVRSDAGLLETAESSGFKKFEDATAR